MPVTKIGGKSMSYSEAVSLTQTLLSDPSSHVAASTQGWQHPESRESLVLKDMFDLQHAQAAKHRPDPYPRGTDAPPRQRDNASLSKADLIATLETHRAGG